MNGKKKKSEIVVFADPNGSGKSTITTILRPVKMDYINVDDIQRILHCDNLSAAKLAEQQREEHLSRRQDFCFETVLSTDRNLKLLKRAREAGFFIRCYYVLTADPQINVARVASASRPADMMCLSNQFWIVMIAHWIWFMNLSHYATSVIFMIILENGPIEFLKSAKSSAGIAHCQVFGSKKISLR